MCHQEIQIFSIRSAVPSGKVVCRDLGVGLGVWEKRVWGVYGGVYMEGKEGDVLLVVVGSIEKE